MLQAPSHLSRVCGHGHIKKFWLMQTQKENQACESKNSLMFSSPISRSANRGSVKGIDNSPRSSCSPLPHNSAFGDAAGTSPKHATFTCAESLSPSPHACKASPTPPPPGCSGSEIEKERPNGRYDCLDSFSMTVGDTHSSTPLPCPNLFIPAVEQISPDSTVPLADVGSVEPTPVHTNGSSKEHSSSFTENSPDSHSSQYSRGIQHGLRAHRPLEACSNHAVKVEDRSSLANPSRDLKFLPSYVRFTSSTSADVAVDKGRSTGFAGSRIQEADHERAGQSAYMQHSVLKACSLCGTTKTPMWRSGPQGPKSLCNACGIRFKKYRSFPGQESSEPIPSPLLGSGISKSFSRPLKRKQSSLSPSCEPSKAQKMCLKPIIPDVASGQQQKKSRWHQLVAERQHSELKDFNHDRSSPWFTRAGPPSLKKIYGCSPFQSKFKKLVPMEDHLSVGGVFAEDEKEAAVLLMHLSCGLVY